MALGNPFNGSRTKVTRRITLATWNKIFVKRVNGKRKKINKYDHADYEQEDLNEWYELWVHKESGDGLLVLLPEPKKKKKKVK